MKTVAALTALFTAALAAPTPQSDATPGQGFSTPFGGISIRSGSPIQYATVNASGLALWLNKPTSAYCPSVEGIPCPENPATLFVGGNDTLFMDTSVPGGQQVYIASDGRAKYTQAHSANTGTGSSVTGFSFAQGALLFKGNDWIACPQDGAYAVYAAAASNQTDAGCLGFRFRAEEAGSAEGAWQYS
ncbi:hypothetical protein C1H76_4309 [Elsinoe australis]|uniref:Uncharacterized protein n=1 Tax=Elsinoe australis TaxID=40998 RepID=A0A4V6DU49_9PEZI|nr:hypothetical protein C1H76_4309 [Elsinoe australis]